MKLIVTVLLFFVVSCGGAVKPFMYSESQIKYLNSLPLSKQVYLESCLRNANQSAWMYCQRETERLGVANVNSQSGPGVADVAGGTILGIGASKILFGK